MRKQETGRAAETVHLSDRLRALADMVTPGNVAADVGCDHGFLSIYLVQQGISPRVIAGDVRRGPLQAARTHVEERGLSAYIETRLCDGLSGYRPGEAQTLICAGMGGRLMQRILTDSPDVAGSFQELILQPQSELWQFRVFLREQGFSVTDENILCEDGKYYFLFKAKPGSGAGLASDMAGLGDKYGAILLKKRHPVLRAYLEKQLTGCLLIRERLRENRGAEGRNARLEQSLSENEAEIRDLEAALGLYRPGRE